MHKNWKWYLPGYPVALPFTLFGLLLAKFVYKSTDWTFKNGVIECTAGMKIQRARVAGERDHTRSRIWFQPSAQTFGNLIIYKDLQTRLNPTLRVHERVHVWQFMIAGILFVTAYGTHYGIRYARDADHEALPAHRQERWRRAYRGIFAEEMAYDRQARYAWGKQKNRWMV